MFEVGIQVRHLDGDSLNNEYTNITIGTNTKNQLDKPPEVRLSIAINASNKIRRFSDKELETIREFHSYSNSYKETMETFGIKSKGSLHYILNTKYQTVK